MTCNCETCDNRKALAAMRNTLKAESAVYGFIAKWDSDNGEYRVTPKMTDKAAQERVAYYTDCVRDAIVTMRAMHDVIVHNQAKA